jgi:hypothetical protein
MDHYHQQILHSKMTLTKLQLINLVENYVSHIIEGLDNASMESMLTDLLIREYEDYTEDEILGEVEELYGEEVAVDLVESASAV